MLKKRERKEQKDQQQKLKYLGKKAKGENLENMGKI